MKFMFCVVAACSVVLAVARPAWADTISVFDVSGSLSDGAVLGGTFTVDTSSGSVTNSHITAGSPDSYTFTSIVYEINNYGGSGSTLIFDATSSGGAELNFNLDTSLVNFTGGYAYGGNIYYPGSGSYGADINSLTFSLPAPSPTPEPSSLALLATGALTLAGSVRRLRRRAA